MSARALTAIVVLAYEGKTYTVRDVWDYAFMERDAPEQVAYGMVFQWAENNNACDCNRAAFIALQCDDAFPVMPCGHAITLTEIRIEDANGNVVTPVDAWSS